MLRLIAGDLQALEHQPGMDAKAQSESFCVQLSISCVSAASCHSAASSVTVLMHKKNCGISSVRIPTHTIITVFHIYTPVQLESALDSCEVMCAACCQHSPSHYPCVQFLGKVTTHAHTFIYITSVFQVLIWQILPRAAKLSAASFRN